MNFFNIVLVLIGISLPLFIKRMKGDLTSHNFKLRDLSKILTILLVYYGILFIYYKVMANDPESIYFYSSIRIALALSFIIAIFRCSPLKSSFPTLLEFPRFKRRSTSFLLILFFFVSTSFIAYYMVELFPEKVKLQLNDYILLKALNENPSLFIPILILTEIVAIVGEELVCRYFAINALRQILQKNSVIIISALIWTLSHGKVSFGIFVLGIFLSYLYYESGSLSLCVLLHFLFNFCGATESLYLSYKDVGYIVIPSYQYALGLFLCQILVYYLVETFFVKTNLQKTK